MNRYNLTTKPTIPYCSRCGSARISSGICCIGIGNRVKYVEAFVDNIVYPLRGEIIGESNGFWVIKWDFNPKVNEFEPEDFSPEGVEEEKKNVTNE